MVLRIHRQWNIDLKLRTTRSWFFSSCSLAKKEKWNGNGFEQKRNAKQFHTNMAVAATPSKYRSRRCSVFTGRYLLVPETREIEGDTLYVSRPRNIQQPPVLILFLFLSLSLILLCTIWLTYTEGETKLG